MIRVLIAEDEPPTLRRIKRMIEQADGEFVVVATAADGEQALVLMEETPCDVLLTDVRMPVMDGLQLMDRVRARHPACQIVIISGYQDFAYVKHAVQASAVDYLLKPVSQEDMDAIAARLKAAHHAMEKVRLGQRLSATLGRAEVPRGTPDLAAHSDSRFSVCLFCAGPVPLYDGDELLPGNAELERLPIEDTFAATFPEHRGFTWAFMGNTQVERILICEAGGPSAGDIAARVAAATQVQTAVPISCAYAEGSVALPGIGRIIARLRRLLLATARIGAGVISCLSDGPQADAPTGDHRLARALADRLLQGQFSTGGAPWAELCARIEREGWTQARVHGLLTGALAYLEAERPGAPEVAQARDLANEVLSTALSMDDFTRGMEGLSALFGGADDEADSGVAAMVRQYLNAHYAEHINNQVLGAAFGYVPSYISLLFRKVYDISPSEYLLRLRLERAKQLMAEHPDRLIRDIAEQVGFKSPHHFSRSFKKYEGVWPTDWAAERR